MIETIIKMLLGEENSKLLLPILKNLKENDFDILKTLKSADFLDILPSILNVVYDLINNPRRTASTFTKAQNIKDFDLAKVAGEEIAERLNAYFNYA